MDPLRIYPQHLAKLLRDNGYPNKIFDGYCVVAKGLIADQAQHDTVRAAADAAWVAQQQNEAKADLEGRKPLKALALLLVDEFNLHTARTNAILDAIDAATNLATLKAAIGAINDLPVRDEDKLRTALENKVDSLP